MLIVNQVFHGIKDVSVKIVSYWSTDTNQTMIKNEYRLVDTKSLEYLKPNQSRFDMYT